MFRKIKGSLVGVVTVASAVLPVAAHAGISAADQTAILAGITASDTLFYTIGGGILVVMAGMWGFKKVRAMF